MARAILIIYRPAAGRYAAQLSSIRAAAADLGVQPILLVPCDSADDPDDDGPRYRVDLADTFAVRDLVAKIHAEYPLERIFPLFEGDVLVAARCRRDLGIPGLSPDQALNFRDKNVMHRRAREIGLRVARSCRPDTIGAVRELAADVGYPMVIKPHDGWACGNTYRIDSADELDRVWQLMGDDRDEYRVEEFIRGTEFHVDSLMRAGEIVFAQLSRYTYSVLDFRSEPGGTVSRKSDLTPAEQAILTENATVLQGFGMTTGVAHVEFFLRSGDDAVILGEAAARAGGGSIVPAIEAGSGINLAGEWCRLELDPGHVVRVTGDREVGTEYLCSDQVGRIVEMTTAGELMDLDSVLDASVWRQVGDVLAPPTASNDVLGWYVCAGTSFDDVRERFARIRTRFQIRTELA